MNKTIVLIPARLASSRLPNKPLAEVCGKSMIQWIYENVTEYTNYDVCIASGDKEIHDKVIKFGGESILTPPDLPSGSDRIAYALEKIEKEYDTVVNFQGDAINTDPQIITQLVDLLYKTNADITTPVTKMAPKDYCNPNCVKAIAGLSKKITEAKALYFSRAQAPFNSETLYHHIGIYAYKAKALQKFVAAPESILEKTEKLEQLRALEVGMNIWVKTIDQLEIYPEAPAEINTPEDLNKVSEVFSKHLKQR